MINYNETIDLLKSKGKFRIDLELDRVEKVLELLNNPQDKIKCIQIAGTNGKGSVAAILSSILTNAGYKTGLYTSPHIFEYTERIRINENDISKDDFTRYIEKVVTISDDNNIDLTEFEILTVVMFIYFADNNVDVAILETGLGGRLDATNVVKNNICSVITHIALDHTERLGDTKEKIAEEKAGIIKPNSFVITSEGYEVIKSKADELCSMMILVSPHVETDLLNNVSLKGINQQENLALALAVIEQFYNDIDRNVIKEGLKKVKHLCRFQYIQSKNLIIDAAHNPDGVAMLNKNLDYYYPDKKRRFIFGCLKTKNYNAMVNELFNFNRYEDNPPKIYFYNFDKEFSCSYDELLENCIYYAKELKDITEIDFTDDYLNIVCGSIYMINHLFKQSDIYY